MTALYIAHMPGAGGNFLTRILAQAHSAVPLAPALYPVGWCQHRMPHKHDWTQFERVWNNHSTRYQHGHSVAPAWLRVTVTTASEWRWSCANALWKNSTITAEYASASAPDRPAEHHLPLGALWSWDSLCERLKDLQTTPVSELQRAIWQGWRASWCPHTENPTYQRICDRRWGHLRRIL